MPLIALLPLSRKLGASSPANAAENAPEAAGDGNPRQSLQKALDMPFPGPGNHHFSSHPPWLSILFLKSQLAFQHLAQDDYTGKSLTLSFPFSILCIISIIACLIVYLLPVYLLVYLKLRALQGCLFCCCYQLAQILLILK